MTMRAVSMAAVVLLASAVCTADERDFEKRVNADPRGQVEISNVAGTVEVTGWDRPEVEVQATLGSGVERIDVISEGKRTLVKVVLPRNSSGDGDASLEVRIPVASELQVSTVSADLTARTITGRQSLKTVSGNVEVQAASGNLEIRTISGDVTLEGKGQPGVMRVTTVSGNVTLNHGAGSLETTTISGDLEVRLNPARSVRLRTTSGNLGFVGRLTRDAHFEVETVSGDLSVRAGADNGFEYEVASFSGDIDNCFGVEAEETNRYGPGTRLAGTRGGGGAEVRIKTMSGNVQLCDR
jgi:DUF4097 and DUF4098 domain-containing protein YvlB